MWAKRVMCIQALKGKKGVASVKEAQPGGKVKKGQVVYGVVVRAAMQKAHLLDYIKLLSVNSPIVLIDSISSHFASITIRFAILAIINLYLSSIVSFSCSLLRGLSNLSSGMPRSQQETCNSFLAQQIRTFIQMRSSLKVVDNSGAKRVMCIQALKGKKRARRVGVMGVTSEFMGGNLAQHIA
ncbi:50S ribosomal protein HLP, mitochondrial-like protein [Tanacetum coccineum]|uniref:50S ribosomal protein HLP, mitochondrial-like protein n=1 Tax=Tanacetum coccineum TaxID=301880 RepID=A0ABQ5CE03_9ASTR